MFHLYISKLTHRQLSAGELASGGRGKVYRRIEELGMRISRKLRGIYHSGIPDGLWPQPVAAGQGTSGCGDVRGSRQGSLKPWGRGIPWYRLQHDGMSGCLDVLCGQDCSQQDGGTLFPDYDFRSGRL